MNLSSGCLNCTPLFFVWYLGYARPWLGGHPRGSHNWKQGHRGGHRRGHWGLDFIRIFSQKFAEIEIYKFYVYLLIHIGNFLSRLLCVRIQRLGLIFFISCYVSVSKHHSLGKIVQNKFVLLLFKIKLFCFCPKYVCPVFVKISLCVFSKISLSCFCKKVSLFCFCPKYFCPIFVKISLFVTNKFVLFFGKIFFRQVFSLDCPQKDMYLFIHNKHTVAKVKLLSIAMFFYVGGRCHNQKTWTLRVGSNLGPGQGKHIRRFPVH